MQQEDSKSPAAVHSVEISLLGWVLESPAEWHSQVVYDRYMSLTVSLPPLNPAQDYTHYFHWISFNSSEKCGTNS